MAPLVGGISLSELAHAAAGTTTATTEAAEPVTGSTVATGPKTS